MLLVHFGTFYTPGVHGRSHAYSPSCTVRELPVVQFNAIMSIERQVPTALSVVAALFLLSGMGSVIDVALDLTRGHLNLNFGALGIPIFFGLRSFSSAWRTCALAFLWVGMLVCPLAFLLGLTGIGAASFNLFGTHLTSIPTYWVSVAAIPAFFLIVWQYRVLTVPRIRDLFTPPGHKGSQRLTNSGV